MKKILFGCGKYGKEALIEYGDDVECFVDNYHGGSFVSDIPVLGYDAFKKKQIKGQIIICVFHYYEIERQLADDGFQYQIYHKITELLPPFSKLIPHMKWIDTLVELCDYPGKKVLEIGSRVVTGANFRDNFKYAEYTGLDILPGENVDIVGDAHMHTSVPHILIKTQNLI